MIIEPIVLGIVANFLYDSGKKTIKDANIAPLEAELKNALQQYLEDQKKQYGEIGDKIIKDIPIPEESVQLYKAYTTPGVDKELLLNQWMQKCESEYYDQIREICRDCIEILISKIKNWPEFLPDMAVSTNETLSKIHRNTEKTNNLLSNLVSGSKPDCDHNIVSDRTNEYVDKWSEPLFLNSPSDQRVDHPVCPKDIYIPHRYIFGKESKPTNEEKYPLIAELAKNGGHLVLGDPGIGKSTLISWFLSASSDTRSKLVYRLTDFELTGEEKQPGDYLLKRMGQTSNSFKNTILFFDGLDECGLSPDNRVRFLSELYNNWNSLSKNKNVSWIVTCRINYISEKQIPDTKIPRITLCPLDPNQIEVFLDNYERTSRQVISDTKKSAILSKRNTGNLGSPFGIPLILYMSIASNITVTVNSTLVDVYDELFPALYHRSGSYDSHEQYTVYQLHEEIHQMSRDIALWMLHHNSQKASIPENVYEEIENSFGGSIATKHAHRIGSYFRSLLHIEGKTELCFIHRTMFEYFVADGFVHRAINAKDPEELSSVIAWYWYAGLMEENLQQYVDMKIRKNKKALNFPLWEKAGLRILEGGVYRCWQEISAITANNAALPKCLYPQKGENLTDDRRLENITLWNLCHLLVWAKKNKGIKGEIFKEKKTSRVLSRAIRHCSADYFPVYCPYFSLSNARLSRTFLAHANMTEANLSRAHLSFADLTKAELYNANLKDINIYHAVLTGTLLSKKQIAVLGYEKFFNCIFKNIRIGTSSGYRDYTQKEFFSEFFPGKPIPK